MMITDVERRLVKLRNEVKAQKVNSGLAYSQLLLPENTPTQTYSDTASLSGSGATPVARIRFRFTRTDHIAEPPMINFAFSAAYSPTYKEFAESQGWAIQANDFTYPMLQDIEGYINEIGDGYADFYVDYTSIIRSKLFSVSTIGISITCQAITNVPGTLVNERLI